MTDRGPEPFAKEPRRSLPKGACDCHAHIFGPYSRFPLASERSYTPPEAPLENYLGMLDASGLPFGVLVHASAYGLNTSALTDALQRAPARLRGIAVVDSSVTDAELESLHSNGVRGVRFAETSGANGQRFAGSVGLDQFAALAPRLRSLGWHAVVWAGIDRLAQELPNLLQQGVPVVVDHMGALNVREGTQDPSFQSLLAHLACGHLWVKMCVPRNSSRFPTYEDVRPFHQLLIERNPDRLLWGSDWPFLRMGDQTPTVAQLIDLFDDWVGDETIRTKVFVDGPSILYQLK
jgi:2-pyrone-4,6-dicarboxylate lactonase